MSGSRTVARIAAGSRGMTHTPAPGSIQTRQSASIQPMATRVGRARTSGRARERRRGRPDRSGPETRALFFRSSRDGCGGADPAALAAGRGPRAGPGPDQACVRAGERGCGAGCAREEAGLPRRDPQARRVSASAADVGERRRVVSRPCASRAAGSARPFVFLPSAAACAQRCARSS